MKGKAVVLLRIMGISKWVNIFFLAKVGFMVTVDFDDQMALFLAPVHIQAFTACLQCPPISQMITRQIFFFNWKRLGKEWKGFLYIVYAKDLNLQRSHLEDGFGKFSRGCFSIENGLTKSLLVHRLAGYAAKVGTKRMLRSSYNIVNQIQIKLLVAVSRMCSTVQIMISTCAQLPRQ